LEALTNRSSNRRFKFEKRSQLLIRAHNEPLSAVAMRVCCKVTPPQTHAKLQPALLRLSAIISNEKLTAFLELERAVCIRLLSEQI